MAVKSWQEQSLKKQRFWQVHIRAWKKSGLSQKEYCRQHSLNNHQLGYWKRKFTTSVKLHTNPKFVPVPITSLLMQEQKDSGLEVLVGSISIKLTVNFNSEALARAVNALGGMGNTP